MLPSAHAQTTGKRLGQIVRFELQNPDTPTTPLDAAAPGPLGHLSPPPDDDSNRGSNSELRQAARDALQALLQGNARFRKVRGGIIACLCACIPQFACLMIVTHVMRWPCD